MGAVGRNAQQLSRLGSDGFVRGRQADFSADDLIQLPVGMGRIPFHPQPLVTDDPPDFTSVYSIVDTAMVGQYHGPEGTAALAVVAPVWNIIYSLGLLMGIGGSVIFSTKRGSEKKDGSENQYFTVAVIGPAILAMLAWAALLRFERPILTFFGANESLLVLARK